MTKIDHPLTVKWLLFGFKGRIGRKSFLLAALLLLLVQLALFSFLISLTGGTSEDGRIHLNTSSGFAAIVGLALLASWLASAWALLALAVKRLHDLNMPVPLAILLIIPAIAFFCWAFLAAMPSHQETNEHGPVPFPKN